MNRLLLTGTAFFGIVVSGSVASATPFDFTYTGSLVDFTVPAAGPYQIFAFGAQGGNAVFGSSAIGAGGLGAEIGGNFILTEGEVLRIAVGGAGNDGTNGGGGGSFVVGPGNTPLVIAGGGGGAGMLHGTTRPGLGGLTGPNGGSFGGGTGGNGGGAGVGNLPGAGGGGFFSAGANTTGVFMFTGGGAFPGLAGGSFGGGFGGGGGGFDSSAHCCSGGGGGGGYSGGGGGSWTFGSAVPGGGGGSFDAGTDQSLVADLQTGNGEVVITEVATPEPASLALLGSALIGLAVVWRRRRPKT